jgi:hypothetical protein
MGIPVIFQHVVPPRNAFHSGLKPEKHLARQSLAGRQFRWTSTRRHKLLVLSAHLCKITVYVRALLPKGNNVLINHSYPREQAPREAPQRPEAQKEP